MKATFTDHLPSGKTVEYTSVPLPVWNTQGNPIASNQYVVDGTEIKRTGLHSDEGKLQDFIVNLMNVHFGGMVLDVPSECPIKKLYTSSDLKFLLDWYAMQLTKNSDEINALFIRVQELERKSFSSSDGYYYITPKDTSMISFVTGTNLVLSTIKNKFDVGGSDDDLVFTSKNPELFTVENGSLVKKGTGIGVLEAASKKNSSLKVAVKVLSIRPEDISIEGVDGLQDGGIEGTTAPDTANLDTNTGGNFAQSVLTVSTEREHNSDADEIKKILTVTDTYNVSESNETYRLNAQGKPEKTGVVGTGRLSKTVTVSYGTEQVKSVTVVTHVDVERSRRTLELKKPVVFIEGASLEYNVQDVLDVKYNGTSESLSGYTVKYGSPFRIEGNKLKYVGTFGDPATLTLVKDGAEVNTNVNTYRLPTFSTVDGITASAHVRKKITVPNPTGPVMSLPGIVVDTTFVQSTSDIYVEATGNTADVFGMKAVTGTLTITQTVHYNGTTIDSNVQTVNVTVTSDEVHASGITLNSTFPFRNGKIVMFNVSDSDKLNNIPVSSLAALTGPSNMTSKLKARLLGTNPGFAIDNDKLKLTADIKSVNRIQLYSSDDESIAKEVELVSYPLPQLVAPTNVSGRVGDAPEPINAALKGASQYNDVVGFSHEIHYSTTANVSSNGRVNFVSPGSESATIELDATLDGRIFYKTYANVNVTVTSTANEHPKTPKRISDVRINRNNMIELVHDGTRTFNYTVTYTGELEDSLTDNVYLVSTANITASVDTNAKTITFNPGRDMGNKAAVFDIMSNGNKVGVLRVDVITITNTIYGDMMFELGDTVKLTTREYAGATYTWHLPDGSTREGRELNFIAGTDNTGEYVAYIDLPDPTSKFEQIVTVGVFSVQETATSEADKEIHVGESIDFAAPPAVGMLYSSDGGTQVEDDDIEYQWQITTTPDVEDSWTSIAGATEHNLKYVASEEGVYYIRRKAAMGDGIAYGGKTKVTVTAVQSTPTSPVLEEHGELVNTHDSDTSTPSPTPSADSGYEEHGIRVNPNDSASTSTPTPTPKPVDDSINKSTPRPVRDSNTPSPKPVDDGSTPTPTPTTGPVL